jgi:hypothetical protein
MLDLSFEMMKWALHLITLSIRSNSWSRRRVDLVFYDVVCEWADHTVKSLGDANISLLSSPPLLSFYLENARESCRNSLGDIKLHGASKGRFIVRG